MTDRTSRPVFILNGPNLNLLGAREPEIYGFETLDEIKARCDAAAGEMGASVDFRQSNVEGELVGWVQEARDGARGLIINAAAYSHTSIALLDALKSLDAPKIEVHLSNPLRREAFRAYSYVGAGCDGTIAGLGPTGYILALQAVKSLEEARATG